MEITFPTEEEITLAIMQGKKVCAWCQGTGIFNYDHYVNTTLTGVEACAHCSGKRFIAFNAPNGEVPEWIKLHLADREVYRD